jgi:hypothetical protein
MTSGSTRKVLRIYKSLHEDPDDIICYVHPEDNTDKQWCIALPQQMLEQTIKWFHQVMGSPAEKHLHEALQPSSDTPLTTSSMCIAKDIIFLARAMICYLNARCKCA